MAVLYNNFQVCQVFFYLFFLPKNFRRTQNCGKMPLKFHSHQVGAPMSSSAGTGIF